MALPFNLHAVLIVIDGGTWHLTWPNLILSSKNGLFFTLWEWLFKHFSLHLATRSRSQLFSVARTLMWEKAHRGRRFPVHALGAFARRHARAFCTSSISSITKHLDKYSRNLQNWVCGYALCTGTEPYQYLLHLAVCTDTPVTLQKFSVTWIASTLFLSLHKTPTSPA